MAGSWRLRVLGAVVRLEREGEDWEEDRVEHWAPERRTAALLALLAFDGPLSRERAAGLLFPDSDRVRARANLRQILYRLRKRADVVDGDPLSLRASVQVDVDRMGNPDVVPGQALGMLSTYDYDDLPEVDERLTAARERIRNRLRASWLEEAQALEDQADRASALRLARKLLALDPIDEEAVQWVMRLQLELGDAVGALTGYARFREMLERALGVPPSDATYVLAERAAAEARSPLRLSVDRDMEVGSRRGHVLVQLAWLEHQLGRHASARRAAEDGLALLPPGDRGGTRIEGLFVLGSIALAAGDHASAGMLWREALALAAEREGGTGSLMLELNLGMVEDGLGRPDAALEHYLAALPMAEAAEDVHSTIVALNNIGHALLTRGSIGAARPLLLRATRLAEDLGDPLLLAHALESLASCELACGELRPARALAARALTESREFGDAALQVESAVTLAEAEVALGETPSAKRVVRAALGIARRHGYVSGFLLGVTRGVLLLARIEGPDAHIARRVVAWLAHEPRVSVAVREKAQRTAAAWELGAPRESVDPDSLVADLLADTS